MEKSHPFLTNPKYGDVLQVVLLSPVPLPIGQILKKTENPDDKDIYRIIKKLVPLKEDPVSLFRWDKIPGNDRWYNFKVISKLNKIFRLGWSIESIDYEHVNQNIQFQKNASGNKLSIRYGSSVLLVALESKEIKNNNIGNGILSILDHPNGKVSPELKRTYNLIVKKKNRDIYIKMMQPLAPIKYLSAMDMNDTNASIHQYWIDYLKAFPNTSRYPNLCDVSNDGRIDLENWKYRPNIRGLLIYILRKSTEEENRRVHDAHIIKILKNLSKNYAYSFLFLIHYDRYFKSEFDRLGELKLMPEKLYITLIKDIAQEMRNILDKASIEQLTYMVTQSFYDKIEHYFYTGIIKDEGLLLPGPLIDASSMDITTYEKVMEYLSILAIYLRDEQEKAFTKVKEDVNTYAEKKTFYKLRNEIQVKIRSIIETTLNDKVNDILSSSSVISFYEIINKDPLIGRVPLAGVEYDNPIRTNVISDLIYFVESAFRNDDAKYLAAGLCLVSKPMVDDLKLLIHTGMRFKDASLIFNKKGIPANCHSRLTSKLGFDTERETKSYNVSVPKLIGSVEKEPNGKFEVTGIQDEEILVQRLTTL